jgi:hypothetical protein
MPCDPAPEPTPAVRIPSRTATTMPSRSRSSSPNLFEASHENALQIKRQSPFQVFSNLFETSPQILSRFRSRPRSS